MISLFSGALGLDLGLERGMGLELKVAVEADANAAATIVANRPETPLLDKRIEEVTAQDIRSKSGLGRARPTLVSAGPSCQSFSTAGQRRSLDDSRGNLFRHFVDIVAELQPRFFVMENVPGVLSAAVRHRPLAERGPGFPSLEDDEQHGSAIRLILKELQKLDYYVVFGLLNAADFGSAQKRERLVFIGSRDGESLRMPAPTHARDGTGGLAPWQTLRDALEGLKDDEPEYASLSPAAIELLEEIPAGGNWRSLPKEKQRKALGKAADSWGGRSGFYRRLSWGSPTPALTTNPISRATMFVHPAEARPLSIAEYARVQGFDDSWEFKGSVRDRYVQIGNAVPLALSEAIGRELAAIMSSGVRRSRKRLGVVACADANLVKRFNSRPRTVLNPERMRLGQTRSETKKWLDSLGGARREPLDVEVLEDAA